MNRANAHFVECSPGPVTKFVYKQLVGEYPTLLELTAAEIPDTPDAPEDTTLVSATSVTTVTDLQAIHGAHHYTIDANIDLTGVTWTPIQNFSGVIEGNDYTISNLSMTGTTNRGIFRNFSANAEIRNLNFTDCSVTGTNLVGILCAYTSSIDNIILKNITFTDCALNGTFAVGCLIGSVFNCKRHFIYDCDVINCTMSVTGVPQYCGMLIGRLTSSSSLVAKYSNIVRCTAQGGTITASESGQQIGGLVGYTTGPDSFDGLRSGCFYDCYSTVDINTAEGNIIGGLFGFLESFDAVSCYSTGDVTMTWAGVSINRTTKIGGWCGEFSCLQDVINCYSTGKISITGSCSTYYRNIGGFVGHCDYQDTVILRCYSTGNVEITGDFVGWMGVGGFVGSANVTIGFTGSTEEWLTRSWSTGDIIISDTTNPDATVKGGVGSFIGTIICDEATSTEVVFTIQDCYAWGSISYTDSGTEIGTGGFVGSYEATSDYFSAIIDNCYDAQTNTAAGSGLSNQLPTGDYTNGFIGYITGTTLPTVTNSFWDTDTSDIATDDYAVGHITDWMQTKANYEAAGWDFTTIWILNTHEV